MLIGRGFRILFGDSVLPVGRWIRRATQAQVDLLRDLLVGGDRSVAPVQVQLPRGGVVLGFSDAAAGESF